MAFSQSAITSVSAVRDRMELLVSWQSSASAGTVYQVYQDGALAWHGTETSCHLPYPRRANSRIEVGTLDAGDVSHGDHSSALPSVPTRRRTLSWEGGTYLAADVAGFAIHGSAVAGGAVDYAARLGYVPAYPQGIVLDGFGMGGFGAGGFGLSASSYSWETPDLSNGSWTFAVVPVDVAGNQDASPVTTTVTIAAAPRPPAADASGVRLRYTLDTSTSEVTLSWLPSPG